MTERVLETQGAEDHVISHSPITGLEAPERILAEVEAQGSAQER